MQKQLGFFVDARRCLGCFTCAMACKNQYGTEPGVTWRMVYPLKEEIYPHRERAFYSLSCNHCERPACLEACPVMAYSKRASDGIVVHDQDRCIGCGNCIRSCPYGAPRLNPVKGKAEKCSLCFERIDAGRKPACVQSCPAGALQLIDLAVFADANAVQFPPGYPNMPALNPSTRFRQAELPILYGRESS
jgi:DMSO reductase iron-sulfur subunit